MTTSSPTRTDIPFLGDPATGRSVAARAAQSVPAYRAFLGADALPADWRQLPLMDKKNYLLAHPFPHLMADDFQETFTIFSSSGSSGRPFYWPQLKTGQKETGERLRQLLEGAFRIHERRTLAIVGLALGSWIGGEHMSWALKNLAADAPYPFAVFSPGNHHDEIIAMIEKAGPFTDQLILFCCPSAIAHLCLRAQQQGRSLPLAKMRHVVIGESFPESVRLDMRTRAGIPAGEPAMLSVFGSADTGVLGVESPASALVRGLCATHGDLALKLGFDGVVPHLFHHTDPDAFLESVGGELCVTKWQGIPLVRYNLHDAVRLMPWKEVLRIVRGHLEKTDPATCAALARADDLPDILSVSGRADSCLLLCGTNLTEAMLDNAVRAPELSPWLTGNYRASVVLENGRQRLRFTLECKTGIPASDDTTNALYAPLSDALGRSQPEFKDDWSNIYRQWDDDPALRILDVNLVPWPALAENDGRIKQRGIKP